MTPASSGEVLRAGALTSHTQVTLEDAGALVFFERGLSLYLMTIGTAAVGAFFVLPTALAVVVLVFACAAAAAPALAMVVPRRTTVVRSDGDRGPLRRALRYAVNALGRSAHIARAPAGLAVWTLATCGIYAVNTLQFWLLARSVSDVISAPEAWVALGASQLAGIVSLLPLGFGASDWSLAAILRRFGTTLEQGTAVAVLVRATITLPLLVLALFSYLYLAAVRRMPVRDKAAVAARET
jgi:uncharacterized membrane protein YbhN (UPF0104 family)